MTDYYSYAVYILVMKFCLSSNKIVICYPKGRKVSLEFKFRYFANGRFAKFKFCLSLDFYEYFNDRSYNRNSNMKIR